MLPPTRKPEHSWLWTKPSMAFVHLADRSIRRPQAQPRQSRGFRRSAVTASCGGRLVPQSERPALRRSQSSAGRTSCTRFVATRRRAAGRLADRLDHVEVIAHRVGEPVVTLGMVSEGLAPPARPLLRQEPRDLCEGRFARAPRRPRAGPPGSRGAALTRAGRGGRRPGGGSPRVRPFPCGRRWPAASASADCGPAASGAARGSPSRAS